MSGISSVPARLAAFGAALAAVAAAGFGLGATVGPIDADEPAYGHPVHGEETHDDHDGR